MNKIKSFFNSIPKIIFAVLCYLFSIGLAIASGFFTFSFYSESQTGLNMYVMGGLAILVEAIKLTLSFSYPFMKYRDYENEKKVLRYLKICFLLSILASLYFFMSGGDIDRSPASKMTELIYLYMPILNIIPLKFTQFITTMSLSILVEAFIIFLPCIAPIMFLEKDYNRKRRYNIDSSIDKIKMILTTIPVRFIDRLYEKVVVDNENMAIISEGEKKEIKTENRLPKKERPQLRLIKSTNYIEVGKEPSKFDDCNNTEKKLDEYKDIEDEEFYNFDDVNDTVENPVMEANPTKQNNTKFDEGSSTEKNPDKYKDIEDEKNYDFDDVKDTNKNSVIKDNTVESNSEIFDEVKGSEYEEINNLKTAKKLCIEAIKDLRNEDICPSVKQIIEHTGLKRDIVREVKKVLEEEGYIKSEDRKTFILKELEGSV